MRRLLVATLVAVSLSVGGGGASSARYQPASNPAWSPDGKQIAFAAGGSLVVLQSSGIRRTLYSSNDACCGPIKWASPGRIVFVDDYRLMSVDTKTRRVTRLSDTGSDFAVSKDGRQVAFWAQGGPREPTTVKLVPATGGIVRPVPRPTNASDSDPDFSPVGDRLVLERLRLVAGTCCVPGSLVVQQLVASRPSGRPRPLGVSGAMPRWSPDGRWIAFSSRAGPEIVSTAGGRPRLLAPPSLVCVTWSPDSTRLACVGQRRIGTVDLHGKRVLFRIGSVHPLDTLEWSPDGKRFLFYGVIGPNVIGATRGIWAVGVDGHGLRRLA